MTDFTQISRVLELRGVLDELCRDGLLSEQDIERIAMTPRSRDDSRKHPLTYLAEQELSDRRRPGHILDAETLTRWLAEQAAMPYYNIDPLRINASIVTTAMSFAFAKTHKILAVEVSKDEVVMKRYRAVINQHHHTNVIT